MRWCNTMVSKQFWKELLTSLLWLVTGCEIGPKSKRGQGSGFSDFIKCKVMMLIQSSEWGTGGEGKDKKGKPQGKQAAWDNDILENDSKHWRVDWCATIAAGILWCLILLLAELKSSLLIAWGGTDVQVRWWRRVQESKLSERVSATHGTVGETWETPHTQEY